MVKIGEIGSIVKLKNKGSSLLLTLIQNGNDTFDPAAFVKIRYTSEKVMTISEDTINFNSEIRADSNGTIAT